MLEPTASEKIRDMVNEILTEMIEGGHDVTENCSDWTDEEVEDFYDNYVDHYCR
jgi:hypothetical protein